MSSLKNFVICSLFTFLCMFVSFLIFHSYKITTIVFFAVYFCPIWDILQVKIIKKEREEN